MGIGSQGPCRRLNCLLSSRQRQQEASEEAGLQPAEAEEGNCTEGDGSAVLSVFLLMSANIKFNTTVNKYVNHSRCDPVQNFCQCTML